MALFDFQTPPCIGVVGLGLIGGSIAKAIQTYTDYTVAGCDLNAQTLDAALNEQVIDTKISNGDFSACQLVLLALYPRQAVDFVRQHIGGFAPGTIIVDMCGVKRYLLDSLGGLCAEKGMLFVGGHPMAGRETWGYGGSDAKLFLGASMILTPDKDTPPHVLAGLERLFLDIGFGSITYTDAADHDHMIAFTSQLAHVVSSAYIKSPRALRHKGFSAGSYKDLTRVAKLNPQMWTELFLENGDYLIEEIDEIIVHLKEYRQVIADNDEQALWNLLEDGRKIREGLDK